MPGSIKDAPAPYYAPTKWTGPFVSAGIGYGLATSAALYQLDVSEFILDPSDNYDVLFGDTAANVKSDGINGTLGLGYDQELGNGLVIGAFADYTLGKLDGNFASAFQIGVSPPMGAKHSVEIDRQLAAGLRLGLARSCCTLWYVSGGYAQADLDVKDLAGNVGNRSTTLEGYFVGGGVEQALFGGLSLKLDYRYSDLDAGQLYDKTYTQPCTGTCGLPNLKLRERLDLDTDVHAIRLSLAYRFNLDREPAFAPLK